MSEIPTVSAPAPLREPAPEVAVPALVDAWPWARPFHLTGWFERNGFTPVWTALMVLVIAWVAFQGVANTGLAVSVIPDLVKQGFEEQPTMEDITAALASKGGLALMWNSIGQIVGFGLLTWLAVRLATRQSASFLRVQRPDAVGFSLAALGWFVLYPAVLWTQQLNSRVPLPELLREWEQSQTDLLEGILMGDGVSVPLMFLFLALTPAIFEELLFRGYLQRQVERRLGVVVSIVGVGILFGAYHLRMSQVVPLSLLGVYMGYVVWATGSLWSGVLVHLLNNGFAVLVAGWARQQPDLDLEAIEAAGVPWYLGVLGLGLTAGVVVLLHRRRRRVVGDLPDARPVSPSLSPVPLSPVSP